MINMHEDVIAAGYAPRFPLYIDSTMRASFKSCEQKFFVEFVLGLSAHKTSPDLHAGGAIAAAMEATRNAMWRDNKDFDTALIEGFVALAKFWGSYEPPEGHNKTFVRVACGFVAYFDHFGVATDPIKPYYIRPGQPAVEMRFSIPLPVKHPVTGSDIFYCGRYDMLGLFQDSVYVVDEKTSKSLGDYWKKQWDLRGQLIGYVWGGREHGIPVVGANVRGIGLLKTDITFAEVPNAYSADLIDRWYNQLCLDVERMVTCWNRGYWDYSFSDACTAFGGCGIKDLCQMNRGNLLTWISDYHPRVWDPLAKDPTHTAGTESLVHVPNSFQSQMVR